MLPRPASKQRPTATRALTLLVALSACGLPVLVAARDGQPPAAAPAATDPHRASIEKALASLRTRPRGAFVILEDRRSGKFVQFAGSREEPLLLDLPTQPLGRDELDRAKRLFAEYGVSLHSWTVDGGGQQSAFQMTLGSDVPRGASVALRVLREVYRLPPEFELGVTEE